MPNRLKILFITSWYPDSANLMQGVFIREHAKSVHLYDDLVVIHLSGISQTGNIWELCEETNYLITEGLPTYHFSTRKLSLPGLSYLLNLWGIWRAFLKLCKNGFHPDIIHANIYAAGVPSVILGKLYHIPVIITEHSSAFPRQLLSIVEILKARFAFKNAQRVTPVSQVLKKSIQQYHVSPNFTVVPNSVDFQHFFLNPSRTSNDPPKYLFVGSLIPIKGLDYLIKALEFLKDKPWTLDILGDGPERTTYVEMSKSLKIDDHLVFHGYQSHEKVAEHMRQADLFILPSLWENLPCVLIEAQACGLPIVATNIGGIPEIVYPGSGWLAMPGDVASLTATISLALDQLTTIDRKEISFKAKRYSMSQVGFEFHKIYQDILFC